MVEAVFRAAPRDADRTERGHLLAGDALSESGFRGSDDSAKVMAHPRANPSKDFYALNTTLRPNGSLIHDIYLIKVKSLTKLRYPWDYYEIFATIPAGAAFPKL